MSFNLDRIGAFFTFLTTDSLYPFNTDKNSGISLKQPLFLKELPTDILKNILTYMTPKESLKAWKNLQLLDRGTCKHLHGEGFKDIGVFFCRVFSQQNPNVRRLNEINDRRAIPLPGLISVKDDPIEAKCLARIWAEACHVAKLSENGRATIVTLAEGSSIETLEATSAQAMADGISSAQIECYGNTRAVLQQHPVEKTQTFYFTDSVVEGSRGLSDTAQEELLKAKGRNGEFPGALEVLFGTVWTRILTNGKESLYNKSVSDPQLWTFTRTKQKTPDGSLVVVGGSAPSCVGVDDDDFDISHVGVGASGSSKAIGD